ncbi:hypothetical protein M378DRAFT_969775 [Amanita muscaria Koide BX008]|uniref:Uncharacterized protein n=1 Tax=Amanita muscaria (strain Koide BX008) TaxID=946122 RepID=A0A0C2VYL4_AMAMK|nr:hypothetical protein M378DRAFT_969775 [Amanita muscaria Koide BX008]
MSRSSYNVTLSPVTSQPNAASDSQERQMRPATPTPDAASFKGTREIWNPVWNFLSSHQTPSFQPIFEAVWHILANQRDLVTIATLCPLRAAKNAPFSFGYGVAHGCYQRGSDQRKHLDPHMDSCLLQCCRYPLITRRAQ